MAQCTHSAYRTGREFKNRTRAGTGRLKPKFQDLTQPVPIEVEYLPENPAVSRIKGDGSPTVLDWLWRKLGLGGLLLALFLAPGCMMLRDVIRSLAQCRRTPNAFRNRDARQ
jgi:hypothetical protein